MQQDNTTFQDIFTPLPFQRGGAGGGVCFLAPMEDVTDIGFRKLCKRFGAAMVYSEFVAAEALVRSIKATVRKLTISDDERPVGIQIYGRTVADVVEAARIVEAEAHPDVIDLNFGCPVKKVAGKGAGAGMLQNIPLLLDMTEAVVNAVSTPVTVKTRLGWNSDNFVFTGLSGEELTDKAAVDASLSKISTPVGGWQGRDLADHLFDRGIKALTIHGRTRAQMYTGEADWTLIGKVAERIHNRFNNPSTPDAAASSPAGLVHAAASSSAGLVHDAASSSAGLVHDAASSSAGLVHDAASSSAGLVHAAASSPAGLVHGGASAMPRLSGGPLIIGNGDITTLDEADKAFEQYGVDAVMIGRATFGQPWLFSREATETLTVADKIDILLELLHLNMEYIGDEYKAILHTRRHLAATPVFKGIPNFRETRIKMLRADKVDDLTQILNELKTRL